MTKITVAAEPAPIAIDLDRTALVIIDMQRDFLEPGGFGETLGNDVSLLQAAVDPCRRVLAAGARHRHDGGGTPARATSPTSRTHRPPRSSAAVPACASARRGPWGASWCAANPATTSCRRSIRVDGEVVIDKPGKGAFYATALDETLRGLGIDNLLVAGVTTEVCVNTTVREANDRGLPLPRAVGLLRLLFPRLPRGRARHDQGSGRYFRLGRAIAGAAGGA